MLRRTAVLSVSWMFISLIAAPIAAHKQADDAVEREASRLFDEIMSPYCPGRTLATCPSPQADMLQDEIKAQLRAGATANDIWDSLYAVYGDQVRSVPRASGFNLLAWAVPGLFFVLGTVVLLRRMRRRIVSDEAATERGDGMDPELKARLDAELAELESVT